jgi:hypothetical protein
MPVLKFQDIADTVVVFAKSFSLRFLVVLGASTICKFVLKFANVYILEREA